jgi:hypothetical protein
MLLLLLLLWRQRLLVLLMLLLLYTQPMQVLLYKHAPKTVTNKHRRDFKLLAGNEGGDVSNIDCQWNAMRKEHL